MKKPIIIVLFCLVCGLCSCTQTDSSRKKNEGKTMATPIDSNYYAQDTIYKPYEKVEHKDWEGPSIWNKSKSLVQTKTNINQTEDFLNANKDILVQLIGENEKLRQENDELEQNIKKTRIDIEEIQQKIELNAMLKDIDVNELKVLSQNNAIVNNNINNLLSKWDKVHSKLVDIEKKQQSNK